MYTNFYNFYKDAYLTCVSRVISTIIIVYDFYKNLENSDKDETT